MEYINHAVSQANFIIQNVNSYTNILWSYVYYLIAGYFVAQKAQKTSFYSPTFEGEFLVFRRNVLPNKMFACADL